MPPSLTDSPCQPRIAVSSGSLTCSIVVNPDDLALLAPDWTALLERSSDNRPTLAPTWLLPWWRIYGRDRALRVALFHDGDRLLGLAPLAWRRCWVRGFLPFRRLECLGADVDERDGVGSDYLGVIAERGGE